MPRKENKAVNKYNTITQDQRLVFAYIGANQDVEAVAATISITNVLNFDATSVGTAYMSEKVVKSRSRWFDKVAKGKSSAVEDNCDFFNEDDV